MLARLRTATAVAHQRLEDDLDLLTPPLSRDRFLAALTRFWGFHRAWEPVVQAHFEMTSKLPHLRRDLLALGLTDAHIDALSECPVPAMTREAALGSLYVLEGSTLGGKVISRALAGCDWLPPAGLTYFDPYGADTGARWRGFQDRLRQVPPSDDIERGAVDTFALLNRWLVSPGLTEG